MLSSLMKLNYTHIWSKSNGKAEVGWQGREGGEGIRGAGESDSSESLPAPLDRRGECDGSLCEGGVVPASRVESSRNALEGRTRREAKGGPESVLYGGG